MIEQILPPSVASAESFRRDPADVLLPGENTVTVRANGYRNKEFSAARACARAAQEQLALPAVSMSPGLRDAPRWPEGMTGSITYCAGYRAAAVAVTTDIVALGVDAEPNVGLPDDGMLDLVACGEEREHLESLATSVPGICWDRLLYSAKLSVYKAWFPQARWWLDLKLAEIVIDPYGGMFTAHLLVPGPSVDGVPVTQMRGRWLASRGLLLTAVVVGAYGP
jgi:4'-phosphopantetheinyl transferase EntD